MQNLDAETKGRGDFFQAVRRGRSFVSSDVTPQLPKSGIAAESLFLVKTLKHQVTIFFLRNLGHTSFSGEDFSHRGLRCILHDHAMTASFESEWSGPSQNSAWHLP